MTDRLARATGLRSTKEAARLLDRPNEAALWKWARRRGLKPARTVRLGSTSVALWDMAELYDADRPDLPAPDPTDCTLFVPQAGMVWAATNRRDHWAKRAGITRGWRQAAHIAAKRARLPRVVGPVRVEATIHKATNRRYDLDGITPTVKACVDGLRDALVIAEDDTTMTPVLVLRAGEKRPHAPGVALSLAPVDELRYSH